jgi:hypothetical protein
MGQKRAKRDDKNFRCFPSKDANEFHALKKAGKLSPSALFALFTRCVLSHSALEIRALPRILKALATQTGANTGSLAATKASFETNR